MAQNKMADVAALFGKKLGEKRLWYWWRDWYISDKVLAQLIAGEAVIVDD